MIVDVAGEAFLEHCEKERGLSQNTLSAYRQDLAEFIAVFVGEEISAVSGEALVRYVSTLAVSRRLAPATIRRRVAFLKTMFSWALRRKLFDVNPFTTVEIRVPVPKRLPRCLSTSDMDRLAQDAERHGSLTRLIVLLLYATGMRIGELTAIKLSDVDGDCSTITIFGKGSRERQVYVPAGPLRELLTKHVATRIQRPGPMGRLFASRKGRPLRAQQIRQSLKMLSDRLELPRRVTPHVLRHTAASALLEAGVDIRFVQRLLGHQSIVTTELYTHVSNKALRDAVAAADVLSRLRHVA